MNTPLRHERSITIFFTSIAFLIIIFVSLLGFVWGLMQIGTIASDTSFWFLFAFLSGVLTIFLPCTLPLAFITLPMARERYMLRSLGMILLFALGVGLILSFYGGALGALGALWMSQFPPPALMHIVPWVYLLGGLFAYALSLGELGLLPMRMPTYVGESPAFISKQKGVGKMFFMGLFLGNVGVGCPMPAIPLLLLSAVLSGSAMYGVLLLLIHAVGRILPLLVLLSLETINVDGLSWLVRYKSAFDRGSGWVFVVFTALIITIGSYSHEWVYSSAIYTSLSSFFAHMFPGVSGSSFVFGAGVFGEAASGASWVFLALVLVPLWWGYFKERQQLLGDQTHQIKRLESEISHMLLEMRGHQATKHIPGGKQHERILTLDKGIETLLAKRRIAIEGMRYGSNGLESKETELAKQEALSLRRNWYITLTILLVVVVYTILS